jgi:hypothetical protein
METKTRESKVELVKDAIPVSVLRDHYLYYTNDDDGLHCSCGKFDPSFDFDDYIDHVVDKVNK